MPQSIYQPTQDILNFGSWLLDQGYDSKTVKSYSNALLCADMTKYQRIRERSQALFSIFQELSEPELIEVKTPTENLFDFMKQIIDSELTFDQKMSLIRVLT